MNVLTAFQSDSLNGMVTSEGAGRYNMCRVFPLNVRSSELLKCSHGINTGG